VRFGLCQNRLAEKGRAMHAEHLLGHTHNGKGKGVCCPCHCVSEAP